MAHDVFISHSTKDKPLADAICAKLEEENIRCWIAPRDIGPGQDWPTAIVEAIKSSKIMVLVFSKHSNKSKQVRKELSVAINSESIVIPFKIDETSLEGPMELFLTDTHWLDAMNPPTERDIGNLIDSVRKFVPSSMKFDAKKELGKQEFDKEESILPEDKSKDEYRQIDELTKLEEEQRNNLAKKKGEGQKQASSGEGRNLKRILVWAGLGLAVVTGIFLFLLGLVGSGPLSFLEREPVPSATQTPTETLMPTTEPPPALSEQTYIPAGAFLMGSDSGDRYDQPVHEVYLDAFWMDEHEVTNAQYGAFLTEMGNQEEGGATWHSPDFRNVWIMNSIKMEWIPRSGYENHPIANVSWYGAKAYCEWAGRRLPTEAEWEKGGRGGLEGKEYPWGDENPSCTQGAINGAQHFGCVGDTLAVMSYSPNGYGLYDMTGNVWEWVADWYGEYYYSNSPYENPQGPDSGNYRMLRGGSWGNHDDELRAAYRNNDTPDVKNYYVGFRCAASPE